MYAWEVRMCIRSQKQNTKHDIPYTFHKTRSILQLFIFDIAPDLLTLTHAPVKQP